MIKNVELNGTFRQFTCGNCTEVFFTSLQGDKDALKCPFCSIVSGTEDVEKGDCLTCGSGGGQARTHNGLDSGIHCDECWAKIITSSHSRGN